MSYKSFSALSEFVQNLKEQYAGVSPWSNLSSFFTRMVSILNQVAQNYARSYALVQQIKYDEEGNITDVTPEERLTVPENVIANAVQQLDELQADMDNLPKPSNLPLKVHVNQTVPITRGAVAVNIFYILMRLGGTSKRFYAVIANREDGNLSIPDAENLSIAVEPFDTSEFVIPVVGSGVTGTGVEGMTAISGVKYGVVVKEGIDPQLHIVMGAGSNLDVATIVGTHDQDNKLVFRFPSGPIPMVRNNGLSTQLGFVTEYTAGESTPPSLLTLGAVGVVGDAEVNVDVTPEDLFDSVLSLIDVNKAKEALPSIN